MKQTSLPDFVKARLFSHKMLARTGSITRRRITWGSGWRATRGVFAGFSGVFLYEKEIKFNLSGSEVHYTNYSMLLIKIMICSKLKVRLVSYNMLARTGSITRRRRTWGSGWRATRRSCARTPWRSRTLRRPRRCSCSASLRCVHPTTRGVGCRV